MSNIVSLDDISSNDGSTESKDSDTSGDDPFAELREACEAIGADVENAIERVKSGDGADEESLIEMARELADDDEMWEALETYRAFSDQDRINKFFLRSHDKEFTDWTGAFYGNADDPSEGTYNWAQQQSRDAGGNLYYYKALFPEPDIEHYPSEKAVLWMERPDDDAHIYVTQEYIEEYGDFQVEIEGKERPVPPWNDLDTSGDSSSSASDTTDAIDPRDMTNDEVRDTVGDLSVDELEQLLEVEKATKDRKGAKRAIHDELDARDSDDSSDDDESEDESPQAVAGRLFSEHNLDVHPDAIASMLQGGMTEEEVVEKLA